MPLSLRRTLLPCVGKEPNDRCAIYIVESRSLRWLFPRKGLGVSSHSNRACPFSVTGETFFQKSSLMKNRLRIVYVEEVIHQEISRSHSNAHRSLQNCYTCLRRILLTEIIDTRNDSAVLVAPLSQKGREHMASPL